MKQMVSCRWLVLMALLLIMLSCRPQPPSATPQTLDPELERLLVDMSLFPSGWYLDIPPFPWYWLEGAEASAATQFRLQGSNALAIHRLFRYRDIAKAAAEYHRQMPSEFFSAHRLTPWEPPEALPYQSLVANRFRLGCADIGRSRSDPDRFTTCTAMAQYGKYLSIFATWISPDGMQLEDLGRILKAIDERMTRYVKGKHQEGQ